METIKELLQKRTLVSIIIVVLILLLGILFISVNSKSNTIHVRNQVIREYYMKHNTKTPSLTKEYVYTGSVNYKPSNSITLGSQRYTKVRDNTYVKDSYLNYLRDHPSNPTYSQKLVNQKFIDDYRQGALDTINDFRQKNGYSRLNLSKKLNRVAQKRAYQVMDPSKKSLWDDGESIHYNSKHQGVAAIIASQMGYYSSYDEASKYMSENLATENNQLFNESINNVYESASQAYRGGCGFMQIYINEGPTGSHYQNLLAPTRKSVGIGFGAKYNQVSDVEDFSDNYMN